MSHFAENHMKDDNFVFSPQTIFNVIHGESSEDVDRFCRAVLGENICFTSEFESEVFYDAVESQDTNFNNNSDDSRIKVAGGACGKKSGPVKASTKQKRPVSQEETGSGATSPRSFFGGTLCPPAPRLKSSRSPNLTPSPFPSATIDQYYGIKPGNAAPIGKGLCVVVRNFSVDMANYIYDAIKIRWFFERKLKYEVLEGGYNSLKSWASAGFFPEGGEHDPKFKISKGPPLVVF